MDTTSIMLKYRCRIAERNKTIRSVLALLSDITYLHNKSIQVLLYEGAQSPFHWILIQFYDVWKWPISLYMLSCHFCLIIIVLHTEV